MITSPVSRLPAAARSYLTAALVLMLVLIAVHFSIQAWGQQQAQQWVSTWEKQSGGHVGHVRLHMLRGALTMRDMTWKSKGIDFHAPFVLLRGNLSDSIEHVDIREVVLKGTKLTLSNKIFQQVLQRKTNLAELLSWATLLDNVRDIHSDGMDIIVQEGGEGVLLLQPLAMHHASFSATSQLQQWKLSGGVWDGSINVSSQNNGQKVVWSNLDAIQFTEGFGLSVIEGLMTGKVSWQKQQLSGELVWQNKLLSSNQKHVAKGQLKFQGEMGEFGWQGDMQTIDWPLQLFSAYMPTLQAKKLNSAYLTGQLHMKRQQQGWQVSMNKGAIRHLSYKSESEHAGYLQQLSFKKSKLVWPQRVLRMDDVLIERGSWAVDSSVVAALSSSDLAWKVDFPKVSFTAIKLGDIAKNIWLPDMQGKLSLHGQQLSMKASSDSEAMGEWKFQTQGLVGKKLNLNVQAKGVPLLNFRDALPQTLVKNARLNGDVRLDLKGVWNQAGWQLQGDMSGENIMWNRGAWLWRAAHMQLENILFSSTQMPHVDTWKVDNWAGQTSLTPWSQITNVDTVQKQQTLPLSLDGWEIKHINIGYGKFSLGQEDAVWFESEIIKLDNIKQNQVLNMRMQGQLADGKFTYKGDWFPWGRTPWMSLHASLKHALPFAATPWLQLSGLPRVVRGRISADLDIKQVAKKPHHYQGLMRLTLSHGQLQNGVSSNKMLSEVTGYEAHGLFDRINNNGDIELKIPLQGNWIYTPLSSDMLGRELLSSLADKAMLETTNVSKKELIHLSNIRLHDSFDGRRDSLKHNERVRLRKVIHVLQREKKWVIELQPQLGQEMLSERLIQRVRKTQEQITGFLISRGISASRIFPVWPEEGASQGESTGILIQAVK